MDNITTLQGLNDLIGKAEFVEQRLTGGVSSPASGAQTFLNAAQNHSKAPGAVAPGVGG